MGEIDMATIPLGNDNELNDTQFYNRKNDLSFLSDNLQLAAKGSTPTILLTGIKGVGKTALIKKLKSNLQNEFLVVYMDSSLADKHNKKSLTRFTFMKLLYESIMQACNESDLINVEEIPIPLIKTEEDYTKFTSFVMDLPQQIYEEYKLEIKGVLIFIDEFQILKELDDDVNSFLWYIRSVIQSQKYVGYIFSGSMSIHDELIADIAGQRGAFGGRILNYEVKTFSYETTKKYLDEKADYLNFTEDGFNRFYKCTWGILYYVNTFA